MNKLILGTAQFGLNYGINNNVGKPSKRIVFEILNEAYNYGIRLLDTAHLYGNAHNLIGEFHQLYPNKKFGIITKFPHLFNENIEKNIQYYSDQLNIDKLRAVLFHSYESYQKYKLELHHKAEIISGLVEKVGVSVYTNGQMDEVINDTNIDIIQIPFNLLDNINLRGELLAKAKAKNKIIHTRSAFLQGLFFMKKDNPNTIRTKLEKELDIITDISLKSSMSTGSIALNYCLVQPNIDGVLIGVESLQQLKENIAFSESKISDQYIDQINAIRINNIELLNPSMWK